MYEDVSILNCSLIDEASILRYVDTTFSVDKVAAEIPHINCNSLVVATGTREENPVRTMINCAAWGLVSRRSAARLDSG